MESADLDLSIIIVTHNSEAVLRACLESIDTHLRGKVCIVDNNSSDETLKIADAFKTRSISTGQNVGYAKAANLGAEKSNQRYLCFLNPDCEMESTFFHQGLAMLEHDQLCCAVPEFADSGKHQTMGRQPGYTRLKLASDMIHSNYGFDSICRWLAMLPNFHNHSWHWPHGSCIFISRNNFYSLGGFDSRYFMYMEDVCLGQQLSLRGGKILEIDTVMIHKEGQGANITKPRRQYLLNHGRRLYAAQCYGAGFAWLLGLLILPAVAARYFMSCAK